MGKLVKIADDLFHIARRLKEIDVNYQLYYNRLAHRYEIYAKGALQIAVPFQSLDARTLDLARKTRIERIEQIVREIEQNNAILEKQNRQKTYNNIIKRMEAL